MKLGFIGNNSLEGVDADARFAQEHGFAGLEYNYWKTFKELEEDTVKRMADIHQRHGVGATSLGIWGWNHLSPDKAEREEAHAMLDKAIEFAQILNAEHIICGAGDIPGEPVGRKIKEFLEVYPPFLEKMAQAKLKPAFYAVHGASFFDSLEAYERVWEHIPEIKIKYDPANWQHHGDDYLEVVQKYGNKVGYVHIKEHMYKDGQLVSQPPAGMGDIQFGKVIAFLYEHGYDGWLTIEPHGPKWARPPLKEKMLLITKKYLEQFLVPC